MKIINSEQGSEDWLKLRKSKITGTDAAIIIGASPFKSVHELWQEKLGIKETNYTPNKAMAHGTKLEPVARDILIKHTGLHFEPIVCIHDEYDWAMASLDGYNEENNIICEIKCPITLGRHREALDGKIQEYYLPQIRHCLWVTGAKSCTFMSYYPDYEPCFSLIEVLPDLEYQTFLIEKEKEFYIQMCTMQEPYHWEFKK